MRFIKSILSLGFGAGIGILLASVGHSADLPAVSGIFATTRPVANLDFTPFGSDDGTCRPAGQRQPTIFIDSVRGSDSYPGTARLPKRSLQQPAANGAVFGLDRGSLFRDSLPFSMLGNTHGLAAQDVAGATGNGLPIISALDPVPNNAFVNNGDGTYSYTWTGESTIANDGYQNVYVVEINTATEARLPVASRRRMQDLAAGQISMTPGAVLVQLQSGSTYTARLHPTDSRAPGLGSYRYEVVARFSPANWGGPNNLGDGALSGLELVGSSHGYGSIAAPLNFAGDRLAVLHCTSHNAVLGGGSLQRSVFYEMGNTQSIQLAWYTADPTGISWSIRRCLFYANVGDRAAYPLIAHSSVSSYVRGDISDTAFLGARWLDGSLHGAAIDYNNVATGTINRVYVQAINDIFGFNMPLSAEIENSVFRQVNRARIPANFHDNIVLAEGASVPGAPANYPCACYLQQTGASATNNLLWARGIASGASGADDAVYGIGVYPGVTGGTVQRNIIVLNPASTWTTTTTYANLPAGAPTGFSIDYNLVVNLSTGGFATNGANGDALSWAQWQASTGLDAHSMYVDLSADPRGLNALFVDPINGDFRWAQTATAQACAAYCKANHVGPATVSSRWPIVPAVDDAVRSLAGR